MTTVLTSLYFALIGLFVGSLLNVCIDRIPAGESIVKPSSHCSSCKKRIPQKDLIPLISYILLRGRCRYCGVKITIRIFIVELTTAILFGLITWHFLSHHDGLSAHIAIPLIYVCIFTVIFFIDLEQQIIIIHPIVSTGIVLALIFSLFWNGFGEYWPQASIANTYLDGTASALLGGASGFVFMIVPYLIARAHYKAEGIGQGDIYLGILIGIATGFPLVLLALMIGVIIGGVTAIALVALRRKKRKDMIPFGPFLSIGAVAAVIWGPQILHWYSSWYPAA
ncbi:MAG: prepilin peptidase [Dehalococcoidia bacterium]|jgi:leader peptidase (prepilin peptidase)/N-methyltransferase